MKYLKSFNENNGYEKPILNHDEITELVMKNIVPMFNMLGIRHECESAYKEQEGFNIKYYNFDFDFNIAIIPYSILWILTRHLTEKHGKPGASQRIRGTSTPRYLAKSKNKDSKGLYITPPEPHSAPDVFVAKILLIIDLYSENRLTINLGPRTLITRFVIPSFDPKTNKEAFDEIMRQLIYCFESCTDEVLIKDDGLLFKEKFNAKDILISYIKSNNYGSPIKIPEPILKEVELAITKMENPFKMYQGIKENNLDLYNELKKLNKDKTIIATDMGDLGFK